MQLVKSLIHPVFGTNTFVQIKNENMKTGKYLALFLLMLTINICTKSAHAQVYVKSSLISSSGYEDKDSLKTGSKGSANMIRAGVQLKLSMKVDTVIKGTDTFPSVTMWNVGFDGSRTHFNNKNMKQYDFPVNVYNGRVAVTYMHTLNKKWTLMSSLGAGVYTSSIDHITARQVVGEGALIFIREIRPNLKIGVGVAFDNTFGFPMAYPGLLIDWAVDGRGGKYFVRVNSNELKAGMKFSESVQLSFSFEASGASALYKDKMFTHTFLAAGLTPEFKVGKHINIPLTVGISGARTMYSHKRKISDFFSYLNRDNVPGFSPSLYASAGIQYVF